MLTTDWFHPSTGTLARVSDPRAMQFWDPKHLVSAELRRSRAAIPGQPEPACCDDGGYYWDMAVLVPARRNLDRNSSAPEQWKAPSTKLRRKI